MKGYTKYNDQTFMKTWTDVKEKIYKMLVDEFPTFGACLHALGTEGIDFSVYATDVHEGANSVISISVVSDDGVRSVVIDENPENFRILHIKPGAQEPYIQDFKEFTNWICDINKKENDPVAVFLNIKNYRFTNEECKLISHYNPHIIYNNEGFKMNVSKKLDLFEED